MLQLKVNLANTAFIGIGNTINKLKERVNLDIHSLTQNFKFNVTCYIMDNITSKLPQSKFDLRGLKLPPQALLADKKVNEPSSIHILLGADIFLQLLLPPEPEVLLSSLEAVSDGSVTSTFLNTRLGYVIAGNTHLSLLCFARNVILI